MWGANGESISQKRSFGTLPRKDSQIVEWLQSDEKGVRRLQYLDYALNRLKVLIKDKPRLKEKVLWPLSLRCNATVEDIIRLAEQLREQYNAFQPYDDDRVMRRLVFDSLRKLSYYTDQIMSDKARVYYSETVNVAEKLEDIVDRKQCRLFLIVVRNLLILYSNYDTENEFFDLQTTAINFKSVSELCAIQINLIYQRKDYDYGCNMYDPEELAKWTIRNGLPVSFSYTVDDPAYKGLKKLWYGNPQIEKSKEITVADCNVVQFFYCAVLTGLITMLEGSRNG